MRLHGLNNLNEPFNMTIGESLHGFRFNSIELGSADIDGLLTLSDSELKEYLTKISTKLNRKRD